MNQATGQAVWNAAVNGKTTTLGTGKGVMTVIAPQAPIGLAGGAVKVGANGTVPVNGAVVPIGVTGSISKDAMVGAIAGLLTGGLAGAAVGAAIPFALAWIQSGNGRISPTTGQLERQDPAFCPVGSTCNRFANTYTKTPVRTSGEEACADTAAYLTSVSSTHNYSSSGGYTAYGDGSGGFCPGTTIQRTTPFTTGTQNMAVSIVKQSGSSTGTAPWIPASMNDIAPYMGTPNPGIPDELRKQGADLPLDGVTVTGPGSVAGPTTTSVTNNSTTNSTTNNTTTTNNYTYNTNTVTNTSSTTVTTTTTAVKNPDGTTTTTTGPTTTTTTTPGDAKEEEKEDPPVNCDKYPFSLGCAELDTVTGEIPRESKTITFQAEDMLGGGQCPADVMTTLNTLGGRSVKVVDWQTFCGMAVPLRALVMGLAAIMAFFIIMPGGVRE